MLSCVWMSGCWSWLMVVTMFTLAGACTTATVVEEPHSVRTRERQGEKNARAHHCDERWTSYNFEINLKLHNSHSSPNPFHMAKAALLLLIISHCHRIIVHRRSTFTTICLPPTPRPSSYIPCVCAQCVELWNWTLPIAWNGMELERRGAMMIIFYYDFVMQPSSLRQFLFCKWLKLTQAGEQCCVSKYSSTFSIQLTHTHTHTWCHARAQAQNTI